MKMKFIGGLLAAATIIVCGAQELQELTTIATGIGTTPEFALKEALSAAVQQAAGIFIDSKTMMKNDTIMDEQVLSATDGFIKGFEKISEAKKNAHGLWRIKIKAVVLMKPLKQKLSNTRILVQDVGNSGQNEWAKIISKETGSRDIPALMADFFKTHPAEKLLIPIVFDEKGRTRGLQLYFPKSGRADQKMVVVSLGVLVAVDLAKYQKQVLPDLTSMLDKISTSRRPPFFSRGNDYRDIGFSLSPSDKSISTGRYMETWTTLIENIGCTRSSISNKLPRTENSEQLIVVNVSTGKYRAGNQAFRIYVLPNTPQLRKCLSNEEKHMRSLHVKLSFLDKEGNEVFAQTRPLVHHAGDVLYMNYSSCLLVSPEFNSSLSSMSSFQLASVIDFTCKIPVGDIKDIAKVSASIVSE